VQVAEYLHKLHDHPDGNYRAPTIDETKSHVECNKCLEGMLVLIQEVEHKKDEDLADHHAGLLQQARIELQSWVTDCQATSPVPTKVSEDYLSRIIAQEARIKAEKVKDPARFNVA
jgi:hypothetical protein